MASASLLTHSPAAAQLPAQQLFEILGVIRNVKSLDPSRKNSARVFSVSSNHSGKEYTILCSYFCPAKKADVISGYCVQQRDGQFQFAREPIVEPASTKEAIQTSFLIALRGTKFGQILSDKVYRFFETQALAKMKEVETIQRNCDKLSSAVMETIAWYASRFKIDEDVILPLVEIGLSKEQAQKLLRFWYRDFSLRRLYLLGLTRTEIKEACDRGWPKQIAFSPDTLYYQLLENPYVVEKIPMEKARSIVHRYDLSMNQNMIECADLVRFVDQHTTEHGWACYPVYQLMKRYTRWSELEAVLKRDFKCAIRYNFFYLHHHARVEDILTDLLKSVPLGTRETHVSDITKIQLYPEQVQAVEMSLNNSVSIITGSGGTGKSVCIKSLVHECELRNIPYLIGAFTGKAVAHLKKTVRRPDNIMTLHAILARGTVLKLRPKFFIIDEISMVPNELLSKVLTRVHEVSNSSEKIQLALVGDDKQVQPIEWGDLFNQVLSSGTIPTSYLKEDHRRKDQKGVLFHNTNQFSIVNPKMKEIDPDYDGPTEIDFQWGNDCFHISGGIPEIEALLTALHKRGVSHEDITIVSPYNKDLDEINLRCQRIFIPDDTQFVKDIFGKTWKLGDRVMMTVNRYDINVMNGEEGLIIGIFADKVRIRFQNGEEVNIPTFQPEIIGADGLEDEEPPLSTKLLTLSWAVTVHKSQGSQWRLVIYYDSSMGYSSFVNCKLAYTGISRPEEYLYVVSRSIESFLASLRTQPPYRYDNLARRLKQETFVDKFVDPALAQMRQV